MRTFQCILHFFDVCESTKIVSAKRLRCMRIDQDGVGETTSRYANQLVCEMTCMRNDRHPIERGITCFSLRVHKSRHCKENYNGSLHFG